MRISGWSSDVCSSDLVAGATHGSHLPEYMRDLATAEGRVALNERIVEAHEIGQPLSAITTGVGVRIYRGSDCFGFWEAEAKALQAGAVNIEIVRSEEHTSELKSLMVNTYAVFF